MRCATVSMVKGKRRAPLIKEPTPGSRIRAVYDKFKSSPGLPIDFNHDLKDPTIINKLTDFYGLDIRRIRNGSKRVGRASVYVLAGEWFGRVYIDYIAERMEKAQCATSVSQ